MTKREIEELGADLENIIWRTFYPKDADGLQKCNEAGIKCAEWVALSENSVPVSFVLKYHSSNCIACGIEIKGKSLCDVCNSRGLDAYES
jgi:hypothetical protein